MKKILLLTLTALSAWGTGLCGNIGKYIPLPVQEDVVGLFLVGKVT